MRAHYGRGSSQGLEAYQRLAKAAGEQGQPLDGLRRHTVNEVERFFAFTIAGPDGHVYWDGPKAFRRNDGSQRKPIRWWWKHKHGPLGSGDSVAPTCGERNCVNPEHTEKQDRPGRHRIYTDAQMLGRLQVEAMRLGRAPGKRWWIRQHHEPSHQSYFNRFGSWANALSSAGLTPSPVNAEATPRDCIRAIQAARRALNRWPFTSDFRSAQMNALLREKGLPLRYGTITKGLSATSWAEALEKAGKPKP